MFNTKHEACPNCGKLMIETMGNNVLASNPPQYEIILWCGCGYRESRGYHRGISQEEMRRNEWERINSTTQHQNLC